MGRKRNTAKTGDKAVYASRGNRDSNDAEKHVDNDDMYNEIDRYNNARDELQDDVLNFNQNDDESEEGGLQNDVENVFDLGIGKSDDESTTTSSSSSQDDGSIGQEEGMHDESLEDDEVSDDESSIEEMDDIPKTDLLNWGKRKKDYYNGDTADLEIGQEIEDAELEEEAGKEILKARLDGMTEQDFMLDDEDEDDESQENKNIDKKDDKVEITDAMHSSKRRKLNKLSKSEKVKLMSKNHPELIPLISHFREEFIRPCAKETLVVLNALTQDPSNAEAVGATKAGLKFLVTKAMLQTATALNVCQYLMIKNGQAVAASNEADDIILDTRESDIIKNHPVIGRLNQLNHLAEKLESDVENKVDGLEAQMKTLIKASSLMVSGEDIEESGSDDNENEQSMDGSYDREVDSEVEEEEPLKHDEASTASSSDEDEDEIKVQRRIMNEARFALRKHDDEEENEEDKKRTRRAVPTFSDFGDEDDAAEADVSAAGRSLAATVNKITQRSKGKKAVTQNAEYDDQENEERFKRGLEMMENELGEDEEDMSGEMNELPFSEDEEDDFYSEIAKKSKAKKEYKKSLYAVAPKYPGMDEEIEGERSISRQILKNRGLVAHKAKINRNPRVKKREQYRKALIKRKGAVREVRTDEGHKYAGEQTGIKSGLSRSRKLGVR